MIVVVMLLLLTEVLLMVVMVVFLLPPLRMLVLVLMMIRIHRGKILLCLDTPLNLSVSATAPANTIFHLKAQARVAGTTRKF